MHEKLCARSESHLSIGSRCLCSQSDCEFANSQPLGYAICLIRKILVLKLQSCRMDITKSKLCLILTK